MAARPLRGARRPALALTLDFGALGTLASSARIADLYEADELVGLQVIAVVNLPPRRVAGLDSKALVLAVGDGKGGQRPPHPRAAGARWGQGRLGGRAREVPGAAGAHGRRPPGPHPGPHGPRDPGAPSGHGPGRARGRAHARRAPGPPPGPLDQEGGRGGAAGGRPGHHPLPRRPHHHRSPPGLEGHRHPLLHRRAHRDPRGRRPLYRPHRARGARRADRFRPPRADQARGGGGPRAPGAAHPGGLRGPHPDHQPRRGRAGPPAGGGRVRPRGPAGAGAGEGTEQAGGPGGPSADPPASRARRRIHSDAARKPRR